ncbi:Gfo/Idh/MocA family oxidoreductase [bacterium AH-315-I18]|nr:Gfo/Idh/MocA family oxidoreductase [bacterium AH-315-I18]
MVTTKKQKRFAIVGTGGRIVMFVDPICQDYTQDSKLVGLCDINQGRLDYYQQHLVDAFDYEKVPTYLATDFERMITETKPDVVIVCTIDGYHHEYIIRAMEAGCDVVTEKPMTTDEKKCNLIFDAINRTGKNLRVTFNMRWAPGPTAVFKALADGLIGDVLHIDMQYMLNTSHGADYFRRWHREKEHSGGLMVHKSTHHFDLINWWLDAIPQTVFAMGRLAYYGKENAQARGIEVKHARYHGNDHSDDPFALDMTNDEKMKNLYLDNEKYDGYIRDRNVFGENIDIEDSMAVMVRYNSGVILNYSLNCYLPCEGYTVAINGTKGRLEYSDMMTTHIISSENAPEPIEQNNLGEKLIIKPLFKPEYEIPVASAEGGHGGGDPLLQEQIFSASPSSQEPYGRNAGYQQGAASALIGIAANHCFKSNQPVQISDLCPQLPMNQKLHELT